MIGRSFNYATLDKSIPEIQEQLIGYVSINTLDPSPEIGSSLLPESWNKGFATEALRMMLEMWWDLPTRSVESDDSRDGSVEKVYAICQEENLGSCGVLRKCKFEVVDEFCFGVDELLVWALEKPFS